MDEMDEMLAALREPPPGLSGARPRGTDGAKVIQVIETRALKGKGTRDDPCYISFQYWSLDGEFLAERQWARRAENERKCQDEIRDNPFAR